MSEQASYALQVDWDRDRFFCTGVLTTDALNLIPSPVKLQALPFCILQTAVSPVTRREETTDYGLFVYNYVSAVANGGIELGRTSGGSVAYIAVLPSTTYTAVAWVRIISGDVNVRFVVINVAGTSLASQTQTQTVGVWTQRAVTFTTTATTTFVEYRIRADTAAQTTDIAGLMLVAGSTAPAVFNAGAASNAYDDITDAVERLAWQYGAAQYTEAVAPASSLNAVLGNVDGRYSPENSASPLFGLFTRGVYVRLLASYNATLYPLYYGTLDSLRADVGLSGTRRATMTVVDPVPQLTQAQYDPDLLENVTTDAALTPVFEDGLLAYPYPSDFWLLSVAGASELGLTTVLYENRLTDFDTGDTTLAFAGDTTGSGHLLSALEYIRSVVYAELGGRFFWDAPTAQFKFFARSRDNRQVIAPSAPGVLELDAPPVYLWGDDLLNHALVTYYPRVIGAAASTLYELGNVPMTLTASQTRQMKVRYQVADAPNAVVAGKDMFTPDAATDYSVTINADGSGGDASAFLTVIANIHATSADLTFINSSGSSIYLQSFRLRGTPIVSYQQAQAEDRNNASILAQGEFRRTIDVPALGDATLAESYANYLVQRYGTPGGRIASASLWANRDAATMANVLGMNIGSYVLLADSFLNNQAQQYLVTALAHSVTPQNSHWLTLTVEPLDRYVYWILGDTVLSVLGTTTRLTF